MFIGSINRYMRAVLEQAAGQWKGLPVYVACSGNFTVERILARCGVGAIHSNDVSIYSCALGWHLAGVAKRYAIKSQEYSWLEEYLEPGPATVATLLLTGEMLKVSPSTGSGQTGSGLVNAYAKRMQDEYRRRWPELHAKTVERVIKATAGLSIASYFAGDCREFLADADRNAVCISFPPTYKGGYERLFKKLDTAQAQLSALLARGFRAVQPDRAELSPLDDLQRHRAGSPGPPARRHGADFNALQAGVHVQQLWPNAPGDCQPAACPQPLGASHR